MTNDNVTSTNPNTIAIAKLIEAEWARLEESNWMIKASSSDILSAAIDAIPQPCDHVGVFDAVLDDDAYEALDVDFFEYEQEGNSVSDCAIFIAERFLFLTGLLTAEETYTWEVK